MLSKSNIKYIQSLTQKKFRDIEQIYIIEGPKMLEEALNHVPELIKSIYRTKSWKPATAVPKTVLDIEIEDFELAKISLLKTPNQVLAVMAQSEKKNIELPHNSLSLALDGIQDPGNLGTIIRIADWFGVKNIICSMDTVDCYNAKVLQSTMGSIFRTHIFYTDLTAYLSETKLPVYGALLNGTALKTVEKPKSGILIIGNESKGISPDIQKLIQHKITIEKYGYAESLNAAVATGIILSYLK